MSEEERRAANEEVARSLAAARANQDRVSRAPASYAQRRLEVIGTPVADDHEYTGSGVIQQFASYVSLVRISPTKEVHSGQTNV